MAAQGFTLTGSGAQNSAAIAVAAGEKVRVRFSAVAGAPALNLVIVANGVTSTVPIDTTRGWVTAGLLTGDSVTVRMSGYSATDSVTGVLESGT